MNFHILKRIGLLAITMIVSHEVSASHMVQLNSVTDIKNYERQNNVKLDVVSEALNLYEATPQPSQRLAFRGASPQPNVSSADIFPNHPVRLRQTAISNDPLLAQQWNWQLSSSNVGINAIESWQEFGGGGLDINSQEIVVAIVDGGFDHTHPDLLSNRWRNRGEIFGNNIDDDQNGYIDDVNGWNARLNNNQIEKADHGTHVAGIIGARGNNGRGIVGLNWRIKIMYVSLGDDLGDTVSTLRAYNYILKQKQLWLQSGGKKGANVVAINSSFGIDARKCSDPELNVWNQIINKLGEQGILSVAATSNWEINVDKYGDIPTSCDSPYLITVTNSTRSGQKSTGKEWIPTVQPTFANGGAGFGAKSIDLAAPGEEILSTAQRTGFSSTAYSAQSGTSFSSPHVAGAVAYLHSVAPADVNSAASTNPGATALLIKKALLSSVTPISSLKLQTGSGGVLNILEASHSIQSSGLLAAAQ